MFKRVEAPLWVRWELFHCVTDCLFESFIQYGSYCGKVFYEVLVHIAYDEEVTELGFCRSWFHFLYAVKYFASGL